MPRITLLEMLLRAGLIDEKQFDGALRNRVLHGGKIGTSLIELGFVNEVDLARFLGKKLAVPYVSPEKLKKISAETIAALPIELALKYQAIPLKLEKKKLVLAMVDPSDLKAVDEISFATGFIIRPVIAPEVRLMEALSVYYQAEVGPRYLQIASRLEEEREEEFRNLPPEPAPSAEPPVPAPAAAHAAEDDPSAEAEVPPNTTETSNVETEAPPSMAEISPAAAEAPPADSEVDLPPAGEFVPGEPAMTAIASPSAEEDAVGLEALTVLAEAEGTAPEGMEFEAMVCAAANDDLQSVEVVDADWIGRIQKYLVDDFALRLSRANDREEIATILMDYLGSRFGRCALFILRGGAAYGWKAAAAGVEVPSFQQFRLPLDSPSVLRAVAGGEAVHVGPVPETVSNALLREALGGDGDGDGAAVVVPLTVIGNTVGMIYGERTDGDLMEEAEELQKVLVKAGLAFEILICREKILMS